MRGGRDIIDAVKAALSDPHDVAARLGLVKGSRRQRAGILVCCPAHGESHASCSLTRGRDGTLRFRCFGCRCAGDIFTLVAAIEHLDVHRGFREVLARAADLARVDLDHPSPSGPPRCRLPRMPAGPSPLGDEVFAAVVAPLLHLGRLDDSTLVADVTRYLACRGVLDHARADGWAALPAAEAQRSWARALRQASQMSEGYEPPFSPRDIDRSGLMLRGTITHPENRLCIPWRNPSGVVTNLQRRRLDQGEPRYVGARGRPFPWPYGVEQVGHVDREAPVAFVEGAFDVLALRALCVVRRERVVVLGVPGLGGWRASWAALARGRVAAIAVDADEPGQRDVLRIADDLADAGARRIERWTPPAKDWGEYLAGRRAA